MNKRIGITYTAVLLAAGLAAAQVQAAIALDRTRVIYPGSEHAISVSITNNNQQLPYLAQAWIEDTEGHKIQNPLAVLPPVQRVEPGKMSEVRIQGLPALAALPQDRESLFYFNLREIPPRSNKPDVLQIALQTRVKLFYRPQAIIPNKAQMANPWQKQLTLTHVGDGFSVHNPTPYYITLVDAASAAQGKDAKGFQPLMVPPKGDIALGVKASELGSAPVLTYINDYGGRPQLTFHCAGSSCQVASVKG
ncbi:fimbria/pilus periplasmic chaperone [Enterobacter cloacae]|uniref:fimbria/pilus periplasmic chaperone n=1 Tax=Enterobacter cloacae TaxID=550 RepID=UPI0034A4F01F